MTVAGVHRVLCLLGPQLLGRRPVPAGRTEGGYQVSERPANSPTGHRQSSGGGGGKVCRNSLCLPYRAIVEQIMGSQWASTSIKSIVS